jgi:transcriptional regulator with XRE-family HTH domain
MGFGRNLQIIRKRRKVTQGELARRVAALCSADRQGITQATISKLETTDAQHSDYLLEIARALGVTVENLYDDGFCKNFSSDYEAIEKSLIARPALTLPLFWISGLDKQDARTMTTPAEQYDSTAYWVEIEDTSCTPHYPANSRFLIKETTPTVGCLVLANLPDNTTAIRIYRQPTPGGYTLAAINQSYAHYTLDDSERAQIIGVVSYVASPPLTF